MVKIDEKVLRAEYEKIRHTFKILVLQHFLAFVKGKGKVIIGPSDKEPFPIKYFMTYFQRTFYSL